MIKVLRNTVIQQVIAFNYKLVTKPQLVFFYIFHTETVTV